MNRTPAGRNDPSLQPIVVCYDGSPAATHAVDAAGILFPGRAAIILYVWPGVAAGRVRTTAVEIVREELIEEVRVAARREAAAVAEEGADLARRAGLRARPRTVESGEGAAEAIVPVATEESVAAVVIGRSSRTRLGSLLPGSVTRSVVDRCPLPVVV